MIPKIIQFILQNVLPSLHFSSEELFDKNLIFVVGVFFNQVVESFNCLAGIRLSEKQTEGDIFSIKSDFFEDIEKADYLEVSERFHNLIKSYLGNLSFLTLPVESIYNSLSLFNFQSTYNFKIKTLSKIHKSVISCIADHMNVGANFK